jgi:NADH-quinone oxidoreductase subunit H
MEPTPLSIAIEAIVKIGLVILIMLTVVAYLVLAERKVSAFIQNRIGPNRVGPFGMFQPVADIVKLFVKEDIVPTAANKFVHSLAPMISLIVALSTFAVVPFGDTITFTIGGIDYTYKLLIADVNVGILYILALTSLGVYGITLSGWSSNNKYSLLGGLRASAQMVSYELSLGLSIIGVLMIANSLRLDEIVQAQGGYVLGVLPNWNIFLQPVGFVIFVAASFAETNRLPFDLPEAEPELVAGYHTEYTGMKFGMFFLAEYANMITSAAIITTLYLGGWQAPFVEHLGLSPLAVSLVQIGAFCVKVGLVLLFYIVVRWTIPRFRYDQLMNLGWKVFIPVSLLNIVVTGLVILLFQQ